MIGRLYHLLIADLPTHFRNLIVVAVIAVVVVVEKERYVAVL